MAEDVLTNWRRWCAQHAQAPAWLRPGLIMLASVGLGGWDKPAHPVALAEDLKVQRQHQGRAASGLARSISRKNHGRASMLEPERWLPVSATSSIEQDAHGGQRELLILAARRQDFTVSVLPVMPVGQWSSASPPSWPSTVVRVVRPSMLMATRWRSRIRKSAPLAR
jgi:hypothetical protein